MNEMSLDNFAIKIVADVKKAIESEVKSVAQNALIDALNKTVYLQQKQYRQTKDLLGAVEVTETKFVGNMATFSVIINAKKMGIEIRHPELNAHASAGANGTDFREPLIEVLDEGTKTFSPIYNHEGYGFFEMAYDDMDANIVNAMAKALIAKGYKISVH